MIELDNKKIGTDKNLPTLLIASSCIDNIVALTGHSLMISVIFNKSNIWWVILSSPIQILCGIAYGACVGLLLSLIRIDHKAS
jgi:NhaP-type Na+/H+ or K+/H+ antiporter